jgi:FHA domain-containing protein
MMAPPAEEVSLTVLSGSMAGTVFIVDDSTDNVLIGSNPSCRFALPTTGVDPIHARLWIDLDGITVSDTGSPRGVYVNDDRVQGQAWLRNGDILWLGPPGEEQSVMLQCHLPGRQAAAAAMMAIDLDPTVPLTPELVVTPVPAVSMVSDAIELAEDGTLRMEPAHLSDRIEEPRPPVTGWDPIAGGMTSACDPPWMAGASMTEALPDAVAAHSQPPPVPRRDPEPPPVPVAVPKPAAAPAARAPEPLPRPRSARAPEPPPAPKPRRKTVAPAIAPSPRRPKTARRPEADEPMAPAPRKGPPMGLLIGGGLVAAAAVAAGGWWLLARATAAPERERATPPATVADARPVARPSAAADPAASRPVPAPDVPVEEEVTIVPPTRAVVSPTPAASRAPAPTPPAVVAAGLAGRAEASRHAGDLDGAEALFDQALRADPGNAAAAAGKAVVTSARAAARKAFMPGRTEVQTQRAKSDMAGFDTADVSVKKAPDFSGRIEFAVSPARVKPGDNYSVQIYLVNEGKKAIKVSGVSVTTNLNGWPSARPVASRVKEVAPSQRALLEEISGAWPEEVNSWSTEVMVTANKGDSLKNLLIWK